jgi:hypothetical protein
VQILCELLQQLTRGTEDHTKVLKEFMRVMLDDEGVHIPPVASRSRFHHLNPDVNLLRPDRYGGHTDRRAMSVFLDSMDVWMHYGGVTESEKTSHGRLIIHPGS